MHTAFSYPNMASPFLMFPLTEKKKLEIHSLKLYSLKNKSSHRFNLARNLEEEFQCCGSSRGWLAFSNENGIVFLLNPFTGAHIDLPFIEHKRIVKVVLCTSPSHDKNFVVVAMYEVESQTKLAFCRNRDRGWSELECRGDKCQDVVYCNESNMVFALVSEACVEAWDMNEDVPRKMVIIQDSYPRKLVVARHIFPPDRHSTQSYLALSLGRIFLAVRYIGESVNPDGEAELDVEGIINYPYKTVGFYVFKFDATRRIWVEVESLKEFALFLGGNESMMLSAEENAELKGNSIYFTDNYWDRMDDDYSYGGHDMGIFDMEDGTIEPVMERQNHRIQPAPFWICLPSPPPPQ